MRLTEDERGTIIAALTIAALEYADNERQLALLERFGCKNARGIIEPARAAAVNE